MARNYSTTINRALFVTFIFALLSVMLLPWMVRAASPALIPSPPPPPPPLPTATPQPSPTPAPPRPKRPARQVIDCAKIELHVESTSDLAEVWTMVQWQDDLGGWHDVEGWQGPLDAGGEKEWWLEEKDFGTGPFRWSIYRCRGGPLLATSASFDLPDAARKTVGVEISLGP